MTHKLLILAAFALPAFAQLAPQQPAPQSPSPQPLPSQSIVQDGILYPGNELGAIAPAAANRAYSRERDRQADFLLRLTILDKRADFANSEELQQAIKEQQEAYEAYTLARQNALATLGADEQYRQVAQVHDEVKAKMERLQALKTRTPEQMQELAEYRLYLAGKRAAPERAAVASDPTVAAAQQRLFEAGQKVSRIRDSFNRDLRKDAEFVAARDRAFDTQASRRAAEAYYAGATTAARSAVDLSYEAAEAKRAAGSIVPYVYSYGYRIGYYGY